MAIDSQGLKNLIRDEVHKKFHELHIYNSKKIKKDLFPILCKSKKIDKVVINFKTYTPFSNAFLSMLGK